jgi:hypothetical protein
MAKLKDRQKQIPYGLRFALPDLRYASSPFASFDAIVNSVHTLLNANKEYAEHHGLPTDLDGIRSMVDTFNAELCRVSGWTDYYIDTPTAVSFSDWPVWAKALGKLKRDGEKGVGDTIERIIGAETSDLYKSWYRKIFGRDCNCIGRKEKFNETYPYA